jgi:hypothetical protein
MSMQEFYKICNRKFENKMHLNFAHGYCTASTYCIHIMKMSLFYFVDFDNLQKSALHELLMKLIMNIPE